MNNIYFENIGPGILSIPDPWNILSGSLIKEKGDTLLVSRIISGCRHQRITVHFIRWYWE